MTPAEKLSREKQVRMELHGSLCVRHGGDGGKAPACPRCLGVGPHGTRPVGRPRGRTKP